jgi:hypothetical protein
MSMTALARITSGAMSFWSLLVPKARTAPVRLRRLETPRPAASAL